MGLRRYHGIFGQRNDWPACVVRLRELLNKRLRRSRYWPQQPSGGTSDVLVSVMEVYGADFDHVLRVHGTDRDEVLGRLGVTLPGTAGA